MRLYRSMQAAEDGYPILGAGTRTLGSRPGIDIPVEEGNVEPETGGMSISPNDAMNLPRHRRPPEFDGTGRDPVFEMDDGDLGPALRHRPDPERPSLHGFVEPKATMSFEDYQAAIWQTRESWTKVEKP